MFRTFEEQPDLGFSARVAEQDPAASGFERGFRLREEGWDAVEFLDRFLGADLEVFQELREALPAFCQAGEGLILGFHDAEDLEGTDQAVAGGGVVTEDHVSALFAAEVVIRLQHFIDDVLVADRGADDLSACFIDDSIESGVAHDCGNQGFFAKGSFPQHFQSTDGHDVVAIDELSGFIAEEDAIGVAVVGDAEVGAMFPDFLGHEAWVHGAAVLVDIGSIGCVPVDEDFCSEFTEDAGGGFVGGPVGAIDDDAHTVESHSAGEGTLGELDIAAECVIDPHGLADFGGCGADAFDIAAEDEVFDFAFDIVIELKAVWPEELDAVIGVGVMGSGDDDAGVGAEGAGHVGDSGGGEGADEEDVDTHGEDSGGEGIFEEVTREAGIFADHDFKAGAVTGVLSALAKHVSCGPSEFQGGFGCYGLDIGCAAYAVGAEDLFGGVHEGLGIRAVVWFLLGDGFDDLDGVFGFCDLMDAQQLGSMEAGPARAGERTGKAIFCCASGDRADERLA
ncbi:MAG: hypothetical protein RI897_919 [Verrucomicrobiota bacterium]